MALIEYELLKQILKTGPKKILAIPHDNFQLLKSIVAQPLK